MRLIASWMIVLVVAGGVFVDSVTGRDVGDQPNIVLMMSDDQGYGDLRIHENLKVDTPHIDRLGRDGARLDRFYVSPVCAPTRASLLTGRYHLRTHVTSTSLGFEVMRSDEVTLAEVLKANGYATGAFGKWHNGHHPPNHPNGQGFDEFVGVCQGHWNNYFNLEMEKNGEFYPTSGFVTDVITDEAIEFIEAEKDGPFFCYVPYNTPHSPFQLPDEYFDKYTARGLDDRLASVYGMVEALDDSVGRILGKLDELGLADNTIVIYLSDNGPNSAKSAPRFNAYMKGTKGSVHEGGVRVPFFIKWPGVIESGQIITKIAGHIDVLPTLVELTGSRMIKTKKLDGVSLAGLLNGSGGEEGWKDRKIYSAWTPRGDVPMTSYSVRTEQYRAALERKRNAKAKGPDAQWELYDMRADPNQEINLAATKPGVLAELRGATEAWFAEVTKEGYDMIPAPVGLAGQGKVLLNAQDAQLESRDTNEAWVWKLGNNYWMDNWTSEAFTPWWHIEVKQAGVWDVTLMYAAKADAVGTKLRVVSGSRSVEGMIEVAHDPAPLVRPNRVDMGGYVDKTWKKLELGRLKLEPGDSQLRIEAAQKTGAVVMQLKSVVLTKVK